MRELWGLLVCVVVYTIAVLWFGMWVQTCSDNRQLKRFEEAAFADGCTKCAEFAKMDCQKDQLQGVEGFTQIP